MDPIGGASPPEGRELHEENLLSGTIGSGAPPVLHAPPSTTTVAPPSAVSALFSTMSQGRGVSWVFEGMNESNDDEDLDPNKSLIEELDIHPDEIVFKIQHVAFPFTLPGTFLRPYLEKISKPIAPAFSMIKSRLGLASDASGGANWAEAQAEKAPIEAQADFWGPFFVALIYALILVWGQWKVVSVVLLLWIIGSYALFFLSRVLGVNVSYSQVLSLLGYSLVPLVITVIFLVLLRPLFPFPLSLVLRIGGTLWASYCATRALQVVDTLDRRRTMLLVYPLGLLFTNFISLF